MRILPPLAALMLLAPMAVGTAFAQTPMTGTQGVGTSATSPLSGTAAHPGMAPAHSSGASLGTSSGVTAAPGAATAGAKMSKRKRTTLAEHFREANTTHDGHLTLAQAQAANWHRVVKNYAAIDTNHKNYVTLEEIHAYNQAQYRAHHHASKAAAH